MDDENNNNSTVQFVNSQSLALRIQKKIASKMSTKSVAKIFIDDTTGSILDNLYKLVKDYTKSKKQAESILNDIIKVIIKIGLLYKNDQLSSDELKICDQFREEFHMFVKKALSCYEIEYSFERHTLDASLANCHRMIHQIVKNHLTDKSKGRIDHVFAFFSNQAFYEEIFNKKSPHQQTMREIVENTRKLVDQGYL